MLAANHPFSLILFGASGHLAHIKIFPALYYLALKKRLPEQYYIIGYARTPMTDATFQESVASSIREHVPDVDNAVLTRLLQHVSYCPGQYDREEDFKALALHLKNREGSTKKLVRLAYLSIPPSVFSATLQNIHTSGVHDPEHMFRCIVEKPVGSNIETFEGIRAQLMEYFEPGEIYILDHYLGKEAIRNMYFLRYANPVIERLLKNTLISHVQITASEVDGLEGRAGYFDAVGTLRDMFQSHLIQIAALLTMRLSPDLQDLQPLRAEAVRQFSLPSTDLSEIAVQGQYHSGVVNGTKVVSYGAEAGVTKDSRTATYAAIKLWSQAPRWAGVPFYLRSGKRLKEKQTRVAIEFNEAPTLKGKHQMRNRLEIILQGEAGMKLTLQTKLGGSEPTFRPLVMEDPLICMGDCFVEHSLLLMEAINGDQQWFLDFEEVRHSWSLIDPIQSYFDAPDTSLFSYTSGSMGPKEADDFISRHGHAWF